LELGLKSEPSIRPSLHQWLRAPVGTLLATRRFQRGGPPALEYAWRAMLLLVRIALYVVLFFLLLSVVIALASDTGLLEKAGLVVVAGGLLWSASLVQRIGARPNDSPS
jgi:hypothetical protein